MKRSALLRLLMVVLCSSFGLSQSSGDLSKTTLDRLQSLLRQGEAGWRSHADVPHPEDPGLRDSHWGTFTVKNVSGPGGGHPNEEHWTGTRVFRRRVQIPEKANG